MAMRRMFIPTRTWQMAVPTNNVAAHGRGSPFHTARSVFVWGKEGQRWKEDNEGSW